MTRDDRPAPPPSVAPLVHKEISQRRFVIPWPQFWRMGWAWRRYPVEHSWRPVSPLPDFHEMGVPRGRVLRLPITERCWCGATRTTEQRVVAS